MGGELTGGAKDEDAAAAAEPPAASKTAEEEQEKKLIEEEEEKKEEPADATDADDDAEFCFPTPTGYLPVKPEDDRRMWTRDVEEIMENTAFYREWMEKNDLAGKITLDELKARHKKLSARKAPWSRRVYQPPAHAHINHAS